MSARANDLVIAETATSTWSYHLRRIVDELLFPGGGAPPALCGAPLGWDTTIKLSAWGLRSHIPETWCKECARLGFDDGTPPPIGGSR